MRRRLQFFISAFALSALTAAVLHVFEFPARTDSPAEQKGTAVGPARFLPLRSTASRSAEQLSIQNGRPNTLGGSDRQDASRVREIVVRAVRNGHDYGWIQLPRGTRVELLRKDRHGYLIRYDEVTLRVSHAQVDARVVVPVSRQALAKVASL